MVRVQPLVTVPTVVYSLRGFSLPTGCISRCYRADPASLSPSHSVPGCIQATRAVHGARGELRAVLHCHIHISQEITLTNPQVAAFIETPAVPEKFFPSVFSLITVLITPIPASVLSSALCKGSSSAHRVTIVSGQSVGLEPGIYEVLSPACQWPSVWPWKITLSIFVFLAVK